MHQIVILPKSLNLLLLMQQDTLPVLHPHRFTLNEIDGKNRVARKATGLFISIE